MLGDTEGARLLQTTLSEEAETDQKLTEVAKSVIKDIFSHILPHCSRRVTVAFAYGPEGLLTHWYKISGDSFCSSLQPWPYSKPTVSRRNEYGRIRWRWANFPREYGEKELYL
jgi:hypothetical protein